MSDSTVEMLVQRHPEILVDGEIDFAVLRAIAKERVLASEESYGLNWAGKSQVQNAAFEGINTTTICKFYRASTLTLQNAYIVGDNLILQVSFTNISF